MSRKQLLGASCSVGLSKTKNGKSFFISSKPSGPVISLKSARDPEEFLSPELGENLFKPFNPNASPGNSNPLPETIFDLPKKKKNKEEEKISTKEINEEEMREILNMRSEVKIPFWLIIAVGSSWLVLLWLAAWVGWKCRQCVQKKNDFEKDEMIRTAKSYVKFILSKI